MTDKRPQGEPIHYGHSGFLYDAYCSACRALDTETMSVPTIEEATARLVNAYKNINETKDRFQKAEQETALALLYLKDATFELSLAQSNFAKAHGVQLNGN